jgi:hypothetical protein
MPAFKTAAELFFNQLLINGLFDVKVRWNQFVMHGDKGIAQIDGQKYCGCTAPVSVQCTRLAASAEKIGKA